MRRRILMACAAAAFVVVVSGCSTSTPIATTTPTSTVASVETSPTTLTEERYEELWTVWREGMMDLRDQWKEARASKDASAAAQLASAYGTLLEELRAVEPPVRHADLHSHTTAYVAYMYAASLAASEKDWKGADDKIAATESEQDGMNEALQGLYE
jgi:hypothetical protein